MSGHALERLMRPASVAVVGASDRPGSYGAQVLENLRAAGFPGQVWGVNPRRGEVVGFPCLPSLAELPAPADAVVVAIPAAGVPVVVDEAGERGCGGVVVFSAGFAEAPDGAGLQRELVAAAHRHGLPVCGPNCNGIVRARERCTLWGDAFEPREAGPVALISQSGNVAVNALASRRGLRFHTVVASGNQAVLGAADFLEYLAGDEEIEAVALYLEDDGGPRLCDALAACAARDLPVAVLKVGRSAAGARAAAAHSAALAGDQRIFDALLREAGAIPAADVHELLELVKTLAVGRRRVIAHPAGGLAVLTCSGGDSAQAADEAQAAGIELPALAPATAQALRELLPPAATIANPLDYTAMIWGDVPALTALVRTVGEDPAVGQVLVFYDQLPGIEGAADESWAAVREGIMAGAQAGPAPTMVASTLPELLDDAAAWRFARAGIPAAAGLRSGLRCAAALRTAAGDPERLREIAAVARSRAARTAEADGAVARARPAGLDAGGSPTGAWLAEHEAKERLAAHGIPVPPGRLVEDENDAVAALHELGGELVLKLSSAAVQHKSDLGAVALALRTPVAVRAAYARIAALAEVHGGAVLAEAMAGPGAELLVAADTGGVVPALILGLGGVWTELLADVAVVPLPADAARVQRALLALRGAAVLTGARGAAPVDLGAAARVAERLGEALIAGGFELIECNPVLVSERGAVALDATARTAGPAPAVVTGEKRGTAHV